MDSTSEKELNKKQILRFNICGTVKSCNGFENVSFCLEENNKEVVYGKYYYFQSIIFF